jgi:hypothetical protein
MKINLKPQLFLLLFLLLAFTHAFAQPPKLYINIVSHNEPGDQLQNQVNFDRAKGLVLQFADLVATNGAKWNLGTCDGFVQGALNFQNGGSNNGDVLETLITNPTYAGFVEIDPRNKNLPGSNIADLWYLLDSCGAQPSNNLSGFIYSSTTATRPDWMQYEDTIKGLIYPANWKAEVIWGAGSLAPHTNDLNDYGIWKPTDTTNFYAHNPNGRLWYQGNGCQPVNSLDSTDNEQLVIDQVQGAIDSIQSGMWPDTNFYCYTITVNQSQFGATLFAKMARVLDSLHSIDPAKIAWATTTEKHRAFLAWGGNTGDYSQWNCGSAPVSAPEPTPASADRAYPNPFRDHLSFQFGDGRAHAVTLYNVYGQACLSASLHADEQLDCAILSPGVYVAVVDGKRGVRLLKE